MRSLILFLACATGCAGKSADTAAPTSTAPANAPAVTVSHPGCFLLYDLKAARATVRVNPGSCAHATVPASTFKVPHSLIALQTGVVTDPEAMVAWDGVKRWNPAWDRDHSLRTSMRESVVWFFQRTAVAIGQERMRDFLRGMQYGNANVEGELTMFWLDDGSLRITGDEQLDFMVRMFAGKLAGIDRAHVDTVEGLMLTDRALMESRLPDGVAVPETRAVIHAKTGTATGVSWWTGRVTGPRGDFVFVSRTEPPGEPSGRSPAMAAGLRALQEAGAL